MTELLTCSTHLVAGTSSPTDLDRSTSSIQPSESLETTNDPLNLLDDSFPKPGLLAKILS